MTSRFTLSAKERLKSKKAIDFLFTSGKQQFKYPFKLIYLIEESNSGSTSPLKFSVTIPKKKIKLAANRNILKRRAKEAYRLNKCSLQESLIKYNYKISLMLIYIDDQIKDYAVIEKSINKHLNALHQKITS